MMKDLQFSLAPLIQWSRVRTLLLALVLAVAAVIVACKRTPTPKPEPAAPVPKAPSLRLFVASSVAGALEPCGCRKDMLGGVDHAAAFVGARGQEAEASLVVAAGPLLFMNPELSAERKSQDDWKAESIAKAMAQLGLAAWAPGANDFAAGGKRLGVLAQMSGATLLAGNLTTPDVKPETVTVRKVRGLQVGLAGVSIPKHRGFMPPGLKAAPLLPVLKGALAELDRRKVDIKVALVAAARGDALRLAETVPGFHVLVVGKGSDAGESNDGPTPPTMVGQTLVVQAPNHLQALGIVDLYIRGDGRVFVDATGVDVAEQRASLMKRIEELERRLKGWQGRADVKAEDVAARKKDLTVLQRQLAELKAPQEPKTGSFLRYSLTDINEGAGEDPAVKEHMLAYYKRVNSHNQQQFKDRKPKAAARGKSHYVGAKACAECHEEAYTFWKKTGHAGAYKTLTDDFKEFNLDCVSCHVTGYDQPGGSTVTFVENLKDVQCEECHGAGSQHAKDEDEELVILRPEPTLCKKCHHSPHVLESWTAKEAWPHIVGEGHGADSKPPG